MHDWQPKNCWYPPPTILTEKYWKNIHLKLNLFTWLVYISLYFLTYLICSEISSTCISPTPRFNLSAIIFLITLLPSSSVKTLFRNTLYWSLKQHSIEQQNSPLHDVDRYLETLKVCSLCLQVASNPTDYFRRRIFPQPPECGARLIAVTNQPVPRPSTTFFACSQANHFFFSTSWKYWRLPT